MPRATCQGMLSDPARLCRTRASFSWPEGKTGGLLRPCGHILTHGQLNRVSCRPDPRPIRDTVTVSPTAFEPFPRFNRGADLEEPLARLALDALSFSCSLKRPRHGAVARSSTPCRDWF